MYNYSKYALHVVCAVLAYTIFLVVIIAFSSCRSINVPPAIVESSTSQKTDQIKVLYDSIYIHDSIYVKDKGDTIYFERWHTKYVDRLRTDTCLVERIDSIPIPYEVIVKERYVPTAYKWSMGILVSVVIVSVFLIGMKVYSKFAML